MRGNREVCHSGDGLKPVLRDAEPVSWQMGGDCQEGQQMFFPLGIGGSDSLVRAAAGTDWGRKVRVPVGAGCNL